MKNSQIHLEAAKRNASLLEDAIRRGDRAKAAQFKRNAEAHLAESKRLELEGSNTEQNVTNSRMDDGIEDNAGSARQPGGSEAIEEIAGTENEPGGRLDDSSAPEGVDQAHHDVLSRFGYSHDGQGDYSHESGATASSGAGEDGSPRTKLGSGEQFEDAKELEEHLAAVHDAGRSPFESAEERAVQSFLSSHGSRPEVVELVRGQVREFNSRPAFFSAGSDLTLAKWLDVNWKDSKGATR